MNSAYLKAVELLARREYGARELMQKLAIKGFAQEDIEAALAECQRLALQNDSRFAEQVCRARVRQGYGPERIRQELKSKKIDADVIETALQMEGDHWLEQALRVLQKKYKSIGFVSASDNGKEANLQDHTPVAYTGSEIQKQKRFLLYRGFPMHIINLAIVARVSLRVTRDL